MEKNRDLFAKCSAFEEANKVKAAGIYPFFRPIESTSGSNVVTHGKKRVMIGSNNYLGLTHHPRVIRAAQKAIDRFGTGCTGSRFLNGNLILHEELEERLADFLGKEACIVFATGVLSNMGAVSCLTARKDVIFSDRENHASIVDATRLAIGTTLKYRHNDMNDLERILKSNRDKYQGALIITDGVFSMSGDVVHFPKLVELAKKYDCRLYVDDAHALGVLGPRGEGTEKHFVTGSNGSRVAPAADLQMATFSKSFASIGGFVAGSYDVIDYLKHKSRSFMFSAALPPAAAGAVLECLNIVQEEPEHLEKLWKNANKMHRELRRLGYNTLNSRTPIIPLLIGDDYTAFAFTQKLYERGVFATPVAKPAVPEGCALIRTSYMASHTDKDLDYVLEVLQDLGREFGVIDNKDRQKQLEELAATHFGAILDTQVEYTSPTP